MTVTIEDDDAPPAAPAKLNVLLGSSQLDPVVDGAVGDGDGLRRALHRG